MNRPILTIEFKFGDRRVVRTLSREWICPFCDGFLEPENQRLNQMRQIKCSQCGDEFRVISVEVRQYKSRNPTLPPSARKGGGKPKK